jgi:ABC-2 type transport system permease protein
MQQPGVKRVSRPHVEHRVEPPPVERLREGSPWVGLGAVITKEMADHLTSARMRILEILIVLTAGGTVYAAMSSIRTNVSQDPFLYLGLFTTGQDPVPSFVGFLSFLVPLISIALIFDSVNGEFNRRTLSRVLSQPIYRDALLLGKFLGGLFTLALVFSAIWLLIFGMGLVGLGVPPNLEEVGRIFLMLLATVFYGGFWLALGLVFSVSFRQSATAALAGIAVWLFFMVLWNILASLLATSFYPVVFGTPDEQLAQANAQLMFARFSPNTLYDEVLVAILNPSVRSLNFVFQSQLSGAVSGSPLPLSQSLVLVWPQITALVATTILLFTLAYVLFQRQEIRA